MTTIFQKLFQRAITSTLTVTSSNGFHLRPIAKFVNEAKKYDATITLLANNKEVSATQVPKILSLGLEKGDSFTLKTMGKEAEKASAELYDFFMQLMIEDNKTKEFKAVKSASSQIQIISKGIAIGVPLSFFKIKTLDTTQKALPLKEALIKTQEELEELYERNKEKEEAEIFLAQKALLASELFQENFENIDEELKALEGTKFSSRIADYKDIKKRIESHMGYTTHFKLPDETTEVIIVADELLPSEVEKLSKLPTVKGVILHQGSTTSHASILLRSFNIPSIISSEKISLTEEIAYALLDANRGLFIVDPTEEALGNAKAEIKEQEAKEKQSYQNRFEPIINKNNEKIKILANITNLNSAKEAKELGADGVGLLRTEFLFTQKKPSIEEQTQTYSEIFELFDEVTIRTLDIGGDKSLPYINIPKEENPFLGIRGIRFSLQEQTLFKEQLLAIFKAVGVTMSQNKSIKIMFPMVSNIEEFKEAKNIAQTVALENQLDIKNIQFGIMIEVPSVIFALEEFNKLVDFYSIGTNDLTQYLFAIERTHPTLHVDNSSPILFKVLEEIKAKSSKPLSICGELAGLEEASSRLINIGYKNLSVSAKIIPTLKEKIRTILHD